MPNQAVNRQRFADSASAVRAGDVDDAFTRMQRTTQVASPTVKVADDGSFKPLDKSEEDQQAQEPQLHKPKIKPRKCVWRSTSVASTASELTFAGGLVAQLFRGDRVLTQAKAKPNIAHRQIYV